MDVATQQQLIKRILTHVSERTSDVGSTETYVPTGSYLDEEAFVRERDDVFKRWPLLIAHSSQLPEQGDFVTDTVYGVPVLVVRQRSGAIAAFRNVCRHRGATLVEAAAGSKMTSFSCPYHAWRYDLDGTLTQVPEQQLCFPGLDVHRRGLLPLAATERHGLVWLSVADPEAAAQTPQDFLGDLGQDFAEYDFAGDTICGTNRLESSFNWKLGVEAFLEVYHFRSLHPDMKNYVFSPEVACLDHFGNHQRLVAPKKVIRELAEVPESQWALRPYATVVYYLFPGTFVFVEKKHTSTLQIRPLAVDRSEVRILHFARPEGLRRPATLERNIALFLKAVDEDLAACASIYRGLAAAPQELVFGRNEIGLHAFRRNLAAAVTTAGG